MEGHAAGPDAPADRVRRPDRFQRAARGAGLGLALAAAAWPTAHALVDRPSVEGRLRARISEALAARLGAVDLGPDVHVDWLFRISFGPVSTRPAQAGATPALAIDRVRVRPNLLALLGGRVEPASIRLEGVRVAPAAGWPSPPATNRARAGGGADLAPDEGDLPVVRFRDLVVELPIGDGVVELGPFHADVEGRRTGDGDEFEADLRLPGGGSGRAEVVRDGREVRATIRLEHVGPGALPRALASDALAVDAGRLAVQAHAQGPRDLSRIDGRFLLSAEGVVLRGPRLAARPVGPVRVEASASVHWDARSRRAAVSRGEVVLLDSVRVALEGEATLAPGLPFQVSLRADDVDYAAAVAALPDALAPGPEAPLPPGSLSARLDAGGPLLRPAEWTLSAALDLSRLREAARRGPRAALLGPFVARPPSDDGRRAAVVIGPANPDFVPIAELPEHVVRAVTTSEDGGFFGHSGFDFDELRNALEEGAEAGRVVRGGSTITQQLAKNLYLSPERTVARKVREAAITIALEASVPKWRLMEIYLNLVEWGPGVHGIGAAARHWFGKDARELTPKEAAFLASVIPNPLRYHAMFARGAPSAAWEEHVDALLLKMTEQGVLTDDELLRALDEPLVFASG
jgi:penicillin-binding protein 1A